MIVAWASRERRIRFRCSKRFARSSAVLLPMTAGRSGADGFSPIAPPASSHRFPKSQSPNISRTGSRIIRRDRQGVFENPKPVGQPRRGCRDFLRRLRGRCGGTSRDRRPGRIVGTRGAASLPLGRVFNALPAPEPNSKRKRRHPRRPDHVRFVWHFPRSFSVMSNAVSEILMTSEANLFSPLSS